MSIIEDFKYRRNKGNELVLGENYLPFKRFYSLDTMAYSGNDDMPEKYKELMGLSASMVLRCNDCIVYHIEQSLAKGATREEIISTMNIALVVGGSIVIPHLRHGMMALEELLEIQAKNC